MSDRDDQAMRYAHEMITRLREQFDRDAAPYYRIIEKYAAASIRPMYVEGLSLDEVRAILDQHSPKKDTDE